jgi:hypothetical protein
LKRVRIKEKMAKKMRVHWVQRQDLRTVTKEPITGLERQGVSFSVAIGRRRGGWLTLRPDRGMDSRYRRPMLLRDAVP